MQNKFELAEDTGIHFSYWHLALFSEALRVMASRLHP
jgi:hypothetical protein